jgi:hypothetical protein
MDAIDLDALLSPDQCGRQRGRFDRGQAQNDSVPGGVES